MNHLDTIINSAVYSINPAKGIPYVSGSVLTANGLGTRVFTSSVTISETPSYLTIAGSSNSYPPVGMISVYGGTTAPAGWLLCNGTEMSGATYTNLSTVLARTYGTAATNNFKLPNATQLPTLPVGIYIIKT